MYGIICRFVHTSARPFIDRVRIQVIGGAGGKGVVGFETAGSDGWKKRPTGGSGGRGGDVLIEASASVQDLHFPTYVVRGRPGGDAHGNGCVGRGGRAKRVMVPVGSLVKEVTRVYDLDDPEAREWDAARELPSGPTPRGTLSSESLWSISGSGSGSGRGSEEVVVGVVSAAVSVISTGGVPLDKLRRRRAGLLPPTSAVEIVAAAVSRPPPLIRTSKGGTRYTETSTILADLTESGASLLVARGGSPGAGNKSAAGSFSEQKADAGSVAHVRGARGEVRFLELELKLIADAGLVGFPNAGKSSLLGALSRAAPRVAAYPFTTLQPHVGAVAFGDGAALNVADIPGLVEGAATDAGLGHEFLRHVERTRALLFVIDATAADPAGDLAALQTELRLYSKALPARPALVAANKCDMGAQARRGVAALRAATSLPVLPVSALTREGVRELADALRWVVDASVRK
jgi:Obg family GTPase CgtA